jgi:hypothetical protein
MPLPLPLPVPLPVPGGRCAGDPDALLPLPRSLLVTYDQNPAGLPLPLPVPLPVPVPLPLPLPLPWW